MIAIVTFSVLAGMYLGCLVMGMANTTPTYHPYDPETP
jgi:hypothetical protein